MAGTWRSTSLCPARTTGCPWPAASGTRPQRRRRPGGEALGVVGAGDGDAISGRFTPQIHSQRVCACMDIGSTPLGGFVECFQG